MKKWIWIWVVLTGGCVDTYRLPEMDHEAQLVVDGLITTEPGPHWVRLRRSQPISGNYSTPPPVSGALVYIVTGADTTYLLESEEGNYKTPDNWQARVNEMYTMFILNNGKLYQSETQTVYPAGQIDTLLTIFERNVINTLDPAAPQHAVGIYLDARATPGTPGFLRWRWKGIFQITTDPANKRRLDPDCNCLVPDPPNCAFGCQCCDCWVTDYGLAVRVSNNQSVSQHIFLNRLLGRIPVEPFRFFSKYYVEVEQFSLSPGVYTFWRRAEAQQQSADNIFQPNVVRLLGNLKCVSHPEVPVFGIVAFSDVRRTARFIMPEELPVRVPAPPLYAEDCRLIFLQNKSTTERPPFW